MAAPSFWSKDAIIAPPGFSRWRVPPASIAIHLCIGSVYAWSIYNPALIKLHGVVASSADDWTLGQVVWIFTVAIVCLGLSAAVAGKWLERVGPRTVGIVAAACWGGGYLLGGAGIACRQLSWLYLGYGVLGGCGLGLGYVSPVSTLIRWFPDRRGMAAGLAIMGFGGGAMIGAPLQESLMRQFYRPPTYLGTVDEVPLVTESGRRFASLPEGPREVVVVTAAEGAQQLVPCQAGVYLVDSGQVGAAETFMVLGLVHGLLMLAAAASYRIPPPGWQPAGWTPVADSTAARRLISRVDVPLERATRTPQFWLLWLMLCFNVTAGIGVLGVAKTMLTEIFASALPDVVDGSFAATFVLMTSLFNMLGRFFWASVSDRLGRRPTYAIFFGLGSVLYLSIPWIAGRASTAPQLLWLGLFYVVTMVIFTLYGGGFATIPAYLADLFGTREVGAIHGRLLTAWSTAGVLGPWAITALRERSLRAAIERLSGTIPADVFERAVGAPPSDLPLLIERRTVTIGQLLELSPPGTIDPSSTLYDSTMYLMAGLLVVAGVANACVRPVAGDGGREPRDAGG